MSEERRTQTSEEFDEVINQCVNEAYEALKVLINDPGAHRKSRANERSLLLNSRIRLDREAREMYHASQKYTNCRYKG